MSGAVLDDYRPYPDTASDYLKAASCVVKTSIKSRDCPGRLSLQAAVPGKKPEIPFRTRL